MFWGIANTLFEVVHAGVGLPHTLSSFGDIVSASVAGHVAVRRDAAFLEDTEVVTTQSKLDIFHQRMLLEVSRNVDKSELETLSFYAFWRLFYVQKGKIYKRCREAIVAVHGNGWPSHAASTHQYHEEYARRTLYAYMPCPGGAGVEYVDAAVRVHFTSYAEALRDFVRFENRWCPKWIQRNYQVHNPEQTETTPTTTAKSPTKDTGPGGESVNDKREATDPAPFPHADEFKTKLIFEEGEPPVDESEDLRPEQHATPYHWQDENREKWQVVSSKGPSYGNDIEIRKKEAMEDIVNPPTTDWSAQKHDVPLWRFARFWQELRNTSSHYSDETLSIDALNDDHQYLFVRLVLKHVDRLLRAAVENETPPPLRLFLMGTAGTGKTRAIQTLLQTLQRRLQAAGISLHFIRCAAPTGSAAFNIRFSATTIHRLIHFFNPPYFRELIPGSDQLQRFQTFLQDTRMILIDEISMVGRQFMGKIDSRLRQGTAGRTDSDRSLGGLSCVVVGDPAQCEALQDQQLYDLDPHKRTADDAAPECARHSNVGLSVYAEFDDVIILSTLHRLRFIKKEQLTPEEQQYNDRATRWMQTLRRLRDLDWNLDDYRWLCKRKRCFMTPSERARFEDAPRIMDFRRDTDTNPEGNCNYYNRMRLRQHAKAKGVPVARFQATHAGVSEEDGMKLDDSSFKGLEKWMEIAEDARVILTHNLFPEQGLMNGTQGNVKRIIYDTSAGPSADEIVDRMPRHLVVDFPQYVGPAFYDEPERRTWVPVEPREIAKEDNAGIVRRQFPLVLGWALTPWKAQGMTLEKAVVKIGRRAATPGVLFVALTRVRHPDDLMLDDDFPDMATVLKQRGTPSFQKRQRWERIMTVKFARTLRREMRDDANYDASMVWTQDLCDAAEVILKDVQDRATNSAHVSQDEDRCEILHLQRDTYEAVWNRLRRWPHTYEVDFALGTLRTAEIDVDHETLRNTQITHEAFVSKGWRVPRTEWLEFRDHGSLSKGMFEHIAKICRPGLPSNVILASPFKLVKVNFSTHADSLKKELRGKKDTIVFPYQTKCQRWVLFTVLLQAKSLRVLHPRGLPEAAFDFMQKCLLQIFDKISIFRKWRSH